MRENHTSGTIMWSLNSPGKFWTASNFVTSKSSSRLYLPHTFTVCLQYNSAEQFIKTRVLRWDRWMVKAWSKKDTNQMRFGRTVALRPCPQDSSDKHALLSAKGEAQMGFPGSFQRIYKIRLLTDSYWQYSWEIFLIFRSKLKKVCYRACLNHTCKFSLGLKLWANGSLH